MSAITGRGPGAPRAAAAAAPAGAATTPAAGTAAAALLAAAVLVAIVLGATPVVRAQVAVRAATVHTMAGPPIQDGVVIVRDGRIAAVGTAAQTPIPEGFRVLRAAVVTPGLIDAHTVAGLSGQLNVPPDQDQLEPGDPIQPELRAIDGFNIHERLVEWLLGLGVTTIHTGYGPGAVVSGQTMVVKTYGRSVEDAVLLPMAMVAATLGAGATTSTPGKSPGTRSKAIALLRIELIKAREYVQKRALADESKRPGTDLRLEVLAQVLHKELPLLVTVHRHQDILSALRLAREFDLKLVLDGVAEAPLVLEEIKASGVAVIVHPTMYRAGSPRGGSETENLSFETAGKLRAAGVTIALQSGYEAYVPKTRVVLLEAAVAAANGLAWQDALAAITIDAARVIGVADRVGSLEVGKDGDLALFDGDPFEYTTHCVGVVVRGVVASDKTM
jgi:imidazolonepropionase-like amidohydrolase